MKIVINNTASPVPITDVGITIGASSSYTIPSNDYQLWAQSDNVITVIGNATVKINDGSVDLSISDGTDLIKGLFPKKLGVLAGDDLTAIGHSTDKLKVIDQDAITILNSIASGLGISTAAILRTTESANPPKTETTLTGTDYTVPSGKKFLLTSFIGSYDAQATIHLRLKKQTGGVGAFNTLFRITLEVGGQGQSTVPLTFGNGILVGTATDVFRLTVEASIANKGTIFGSYCGAEV